ncbi:MAG: hypothetical protein AAFR17_00110 [Pseudomonadota bacterium]
MGVLKSGTLSNFQANTLAGRMDEEFKTLFEATKGMKLPDDPASVEDRRIMFVAIAVGTLRYLAENKGQLDISTETAGGVSGSSHDHQLEFSWERGS